LGVHGWEAVWTLQGATPIAGGPNSGFGYYSSNISYSSFFSKYTINPDLENSGSTFSQKQWGACTYISWSNLLTQTRRHEYNHATQSHHGKYVNAVNDPANNPGEYVESRVAPPNTSLSGFDNATGQQVQNRLTTVDGLTHQEPYPVNYTATGTPLGNVNYSPYANCP
jgi:hypothetical protein